MDLLRKYMKTKLLLSWCMEMISIPWKVGSGIKVSYGSGSWSWIVPQNPSVFSKQEIVFARTSPKHKLEIGEFLQLVYSGLC